MDETESPSAVNVSRLDAAEIAAVGSSSFAEITAKLAQFSASLGPTGEALGRIARSAKAADDAQIVAIRHSVPYIPPNPVHESNRRLAELQALLQDQVQMATEREGAVAKREASATIRERRNFRVMVVGIAISALGVAVAVVSLFR